jgi:hypothetical protein
MRRLSSSNPDRFHGKRSIVHPKRRGRMSSKTRSRLRKSRRNSAVSRRLVGGRRKKRTRYKARGGNITIYDPGGEKLCIPVESPITCREIKKRLEQYSGGKVFPDERGIYEPVQLYKKDSKEELSDYTPVAINETIYMINNCKHWYAKDKEMFRRMSDYNFLNTEDVRAIVISSSVGLQPEGYPKGSCRCYRYCRCHPRQWGNIKSEYVQQHDGHKRSRRCDWGDVED